MNPIIDQAAELRRLVRHAARREAASGYDAPRSVFVTSAKVGAGATTIAGRLALASAREGVRVVLADIDPHGGDLAERMGVTPKAHIGHVLNGSCELHEALVGGPMGIQILPGDRTPLGAPTRYGAARLVSDFRSLGRHADLVIYDAGCRPESPQQTFWDGADEVLMATTPDNLGVLDAYSILKENHSRSNPNLAVIVNRAIDSAQATDVYGRIRRSCRQFLKTDIAWRGWLPYSNALSQTDSPSNADGVGSTEEFFEQLARDYQPHPHSPSSFRSRTAPHAA